MVNGRQLPHTGKYPSPIAAYEYYLTIDFVIVQQYKGFTSEVTSLVFSPMEHILFAGSYAGTVIAYDLNS